MGDGRRNFAVNGDGICGDIVQQHHGYATACIFIRECASVCNFPAWHVLEANHWACSFYWPGEWHRGSGCASWTYIARRRAPWYPRWVDYSFALVSEPNGTEFL